jgi:hypothetical protein
VGTSHSGINKLPSNAGQFSLYRNNPGNPASLGINAIGAFAEDKRGNIWIATWGGGLDRFNPADGTFAHYHHDPENPNSLSDDLFMDVLCRSVQHGLGWHAWQGLEPPQPCHGTRHTHYLHDPESPNSLADDNIAAFLPDKNGGLWVATFGGVSHYDPHTDTFTNYSNDPANPSSLSTTCGQFVSGFKEHSLDRNMGRRTESTGLERPASHGPENCHVTRYIHQPITPTASAKTRSGPFTKP